MYTPQRNRLGVRHRSFHLGRCTELYYLCLKQSLVLVFPYYFRQDFQGNFVLWFFFDPACDEAFLYWFFPWKGSILLKGLIFSPLYLLLSFLNCFCSDITLSKSSDCLWRKCFNGIVFPSHYLGLESGLLHLRAAHLIWFEDLLGVFFLLFSFMHRQCSIVPKIDQSKIIQCFFRAAWLCLSC